MPRVCHLFLYGRACINITVTNSWLRERFGGAASVNLLVLKCFPEGVEISKGIEI